MRVNRTESISLSILALLCSVLATLEPPLSTKSAIGMTFLTIVPATIFGAIIVYSYANHLKRLFDFMKISSRSSSSSQPPSYIDDLHDLDTSLTSSLPLSPSFSTINNNPTNSIKQSLLDDHT
jgi:hypothetical protein